MVDNHMINFNYDLSSNHLRGYIFRFSCSSCFFGDRDTFFQGAIQFVFLVVSVIFYGLYLFLMRKISPRHKEISEVITSFEYPYINFLSSSPANTLFAFWFHGFTLFAICYTAFEILNKI